MIRGGVVTNIAASGFDGWLRVTVDHGRGIPNSTFVAPLDEARTWFVGQWVALDVNPATTALRAELARTGN